VEVFVVMVLVSEVVVEIGVSGGSRRSSSGCSSSGDGDGGSRRSSSVS